MRPLMRQGRKPLLRAGRGARFGKTARPASSRQAAGCAGHGTRLGTARYSLDFRLSTMSMRRSLPRMARATMPENTMVSANAMAKLAAWMSRPNMT